MSFLINAPTLQLQVLYYYNSIESIKLDYYNSIESIKLDAILMSVSINAPTL